VRFERAFGGWLRRSHKRPNAAFVLRFEDVDVGVIEVDYERLAQ
jgi:hypothetical protein